MQVERSSFVFGNEATSDGVDESSDLLMRKVLMKQVERWGRALQLRRSRRDEVGSMNRKRAGKQAKGRKLLGRRSVRSAGR